MNAKSSALAALLAVSLLGTSPARACGGFFCSSSQPVNQAAERIIFSENGDGTVTAVIQILYQGPSQNFSWLLPISTVPEGDDDIGIASDIAFQRLQAATNPLYTLTTRFEGECRDFGGRANFAPGSSPVPANGSVSDADGPGVTVEASGVVGDYVNTPYHNLCSEDYGHLPAAFLILNPLPNTV